MKYTKELPNESGHYWILYPNGTEEVRHIDTNLPYECYGLYHYAGPIKDKPEKPDPALKPCPHCGGEAEMAKGTKHKLFMGRCKSHCTEWRGIEDVAMSNWNARAGD